jgi:hypothetical protein
MHNVTLGRIVAIDLEARLISVESRLGEVFEVPASKCEAMGLEVAVHCLNGAPYSVTSIADWADVADERTASYRIAGLA